jgi:hypothetical protein
MRFAFPCRKFTGASDGTQLEEAAMSKGVTARVRAAMRHGSNREAFHAGFNLKHLEDSYYLTARCLRRVL